MERTLPLDAMTVAEKLGVMEALWDDLCRHPEQLPSPAWHEQVLKQRTQIMDGGGAHFQDWDEAKEQIRKQVK